MRAHFRLDFHLPQILRLIVTIVGFAIVVLLVAGVSQNERYINENGIRTDVNEYEQSLSRGYHEYHQRVGKLLIANIVFSCVLLDVTGFIGLGTAFDLLKKTSKLRIFEQWFNIAASFCHIALSSFMLIDEGQKYGSYWKSRFNGGFVLISIAGSLGITVSGPLYVILACLLYKGDGRPLFLNLSLTQREVQLLEVDDAPPPYSEAWNPNNNRQEGNVEVATIYNPTQPSMSSPI